MSTRLSRRHALRLLAAGLVTACAKTQAPLGPLPEGPIQLGWRWVPGQEYTYNTVVEQRRGELRVSRAEEWTYLVRALSRENVALLEGRLSGFGAGAHVQERPVEKHKLASAIHGEKERMLKQATIEITMNGRIIEPASTEFESGLPHRMLDLALPTDPVLPHTRWATDQVLLPFADLLPDGLRTTHAAASRIISLRHVERMVTATIETSGAIHAENGETFLGVHGLTIWNAEHGHLMERTLRVHLPEIQGTRFVDPGVLHITTQLV